MLLAPPSANVQEIRGLLRMNHMKLTSALIASALLLAPATGVYAAHTGGATFTAMLDGASEVPGPGDPDGFGNITMSVNPGQERVCYSLRVSDIEPATAAHIHEADAGMSGPVVVALSAPTGGSSQGCATLSRELAKDIIKNPSDYYVNVHNAEYPGGAVRGQLGR